ncbi:hypothetical protein GCM10020295_34300 [Streptomyces cinereospinus]
MAAPLQLTRMHRVLIGVVVFGAVIIAGIGFAGSYAAVRALALKKGFGDFSYVFPIGIDAGICVLLALDLLLTWIRIPFPLLRQTAWLLTAATIAFNGAAAWPDPLGVGMHGVIPILFVVAVEAARHAIGRIADITADKHMEGVRLTRWLLSPVPTFLLWRRMKLWELRSYDQVIKLEQERLVYQARLRSRYGRAWRRKAPVEALMPLRLAKYGVPLADTAPAGLAAAGIEPALIPPAPPAPQLTAAEPVTAVAEKTVAAPPPGGARRPPTSPRPPRPRCRTGRPSRRTSGCTPGTRSPSSTTAATTPTTTRRPRTPSGTRSSVGRSSTSSRTRNPPSAEPSPEDTGTFPIPVGPGRTRELGEGGGTLPPGAGRRCVLPGLQAVDQRQLSDAEPVGRQHRGGVRHPPGGRGRQAPGQPVHQPPLRGAGGGPHRVGGHRREDMTKGPPSRGPLLP